MTTRINLLPHREQKKKQRQQQLAILAGLVAAVGAVVAFSIHTVIGGKIDNQENRNKFLQGEIVKLDKEIEEIKQLKVQVQSLLDRKKVVESLQSDRSQVVLLFDDLIRRLPDGMYLTSVKQTGKAIALSGITQSNARVSTLMRALNESPYLEGPILKEIKAATVNNMRVSSFSITIQISPPPAVVAGAPAPAQPAGAKPATGMSGNPK
jgi:type IV pilus assembly protein PilN